MAQVLYDVKATIRATSKNPHVTIPALSVTGIAFCEKKTSINSISLKTEEFLKNGYTANDIDTLKVSIKSVRKIKQDFTCKV